jgi:predicted HTH transcriptional regulator
MAQALDAQLNVITAVVNDIRDEQRSELPRPVAKLLREVSEIKRQAKRDSRELTVDERRRLEEIPDEISRIWQQIALASDNLDFAIENATPEESASTRRRVDEFFAEYPKEWAIIKMTKLDELSNKELAKREKLSEARISQKLRDAMEMFHRFLDD